MVGNNDRSGGGGGNKPQGRRGSKKRGSSTGSSSRGGGGGGGGSSSNHDTGPGERSFPVVSDSRFSSMHSAPVSLERSPSLTNKPRQRSGGESETVLVVYLRTRYIRILRTVLIWPEI